MRNHTQNGAIKDHLCKQNKTNYLELSNLEKNVRSIKHIHDLSRLQIYKTLLILSENPLFSSSRQFLQPPEALSQISKRFK